MSRVSIQSKLLVMLLITSILSAAVVGCHRLSSRAALRYEASAFDRLTEIRESQIAPTAGQVHRSEDSSIMFTRGSTTSRGHRGVHRRRSTNSTRQRSTRRNGSRSSTTTTTSSPKAEHAQTGNAVDVDALLPDFERAAVSAGLLHRALRRPGQGDRFDDARDGSAWSAANARFNDFFREIVLAVQLRGRAAARHGGQCRLHRLQGCRSRAPTSSPARTAEGTALTPTERPWLQRGGLCGRHRLQRLPARRRADGLDGRAGRGARDASKAFSRCSSRSPKINRLMTVGQAVGSRRAWARPARPSWSGRTV